MIDPTTKELKYPVIQSPMAGCSDLAFRLVSRRRGMRYCFLEMVSAVGLTRESRHTLELMKTIPEDQPLGAQLVGCDPEVMGEAARKIEELQFEHIDLNLGCPVRKVTSQGAGASLLEDREKAGRLFKKVVQSVKIPVTVKMRKGFKDESGQQAVAMAQVAEDSGISAITVHGRTQAQGYSGPADWGCIAQVKRKVQIPVIGNGDILSGRDAQRMREVTHCDGFMVGRGGLGNPWLFQEIHSTLFSQHPFSPPTREQKREAAIEHLELEVELLGAERAVFPMRRIGAWYLAGIPHASAWRAQLNHCRDIGAIRDVLNRSFES